MEVDPVLLTEILERLSVAIDAGIPVRRIKCGPDGIEIEIADSRPEPTSTPFVRTTRIDAEDLDVNPYDRVFKGQRPTFRSE